MKTYRLALPVFVALLVAGAFWAGTRFSGTPAQPPGGSDKRQVLYYIDPMTPGYRSDSPGIAPCGMPLEPVYAEAGASDDLPLAAGAVRVSAERQQLIGVKSRAAEVRPLTYTLRLYGKVVPDETRVFRVNASTDSWIRELSDVTTGSFVKKGQILAEALAPAYYNAQVTYLIALDNLDRIQEQLGGQLRHQQSDLANNQMRVAVQALQNLGITDEQVAELANTRKARPYLQVRSPTRGFVLSRNLTLNQWFKAAEEFYTIADIGKVWVYCDVYEDEARYVRPGTVVWVKHAQLGKSFEAAVSKVLPLFDPVSKTLKVRVDVDNPDFELRPEMFVDVEIPITMPPALHVSADAVSDTGMKSIVYVNLGDGTIEPREVETGWRLGRQVEIRSGLMPGEQVVVSGNFLIDSESRMKTSAAVSAMNETRDVVCGKQVTKGLAEEAGRTVVHQGRTFYFCSSDCMLDFLADINSYLAKAGLDRHMQVAAEGAVVVDPVCTMAVSVEQASAAGWVVRLDGETFYFCSEKCKNSFLFNPAAYRGTGGATHGSVPVPSPPDPPEEKARAPLPPRASATAIPDTPPGEVDWTASHDPVMRRRSKSVGIVDWDGPDRDPVDGAARNWQEGWGSFPGAEYLGLKDRKRWTPPAPAQGSATAAVQSDEPPPAPEMAAREQGAASEGGQAGQ